MSNLNPKFIGAWLAFTSAGWAIGAAISAATGDISALDASIGAAAGSAAISTYSII